MYKFSIKLHFSKNIIAHAYFRRRILSKSFGGKIEDFKTSFNTWKSWGKNFIPEQAINKTTTGKKVEYLFLENVCRNKFLTGNYL